jgi:hypothetical protein
VRPPFANGAAAEAQFAYGTNYLPTELPTEPNSWAAKKPDLICQEWSRRCSRIADAAELPTETDLNLQTEPPTELNCRWSANGAKFANGSKFLDRAANGAELPMEQNCRRSRIADGAEFADGAADGAELPMNCRRIRICRPSRRFGTPQDAGPKYLPAELPQLSTEPQDPNLLFSLVACFIVFPFSNNIRTSVPFLQTT